MILYPLNFKEDEVLTCFCLEKNSEVTLIHLESKIFQSCNTNAQKKEFYKSYKCLFYCVNDTKKYYFSFKRSENMCFGDQACLAWEEGSDFTYLAFPTKKHMDLELQLFQSGSDGKGPFITTCISSFKRNVTMSNDELSKVNVEELKNETKTLPNQTWTDTNDTPPSVSKDPFNQKLEEEISKYMTKAII